MSGGAPVRLLAADVDGTLLDPRHRVTPSTYRAVASLRARGVQVVLTSARFAPALLPIHRTLGLAEAPIVACQGAAIVRPGDQDPTVVREDPIAPLVVRDLIDAAERRGWGISLYTASQWWASTGDSFVAQEETVTGVAAHRTPYLRAQVDGVLKVTIMTTIPQASAARTTARAVGRGEISAAVSRPDYVEIVRRDISKWSAISHLAATTGIAPDEIAAIGDGLNDVEMIAAAAVGIAMGHAPRAVHAAATFTVGSNADDGFAMAVEALTARGLLTRAASPHRR